MVTLRWDDLCVIGWYGRDGTPYLSSWTGDTPIIKVVVVGHPVPLYTDGIAPGVTAHPVPAGRDPFEYAKALDGVVALAWQRPVRQRRKVAA